MSRHPKQNEDWPQSGDGIRAGQSGRDYFHGVYRDDMDGEERWLFLTSGPKVDSIERLLKHVQPPSTVVELGSGPGAVILGCRARGIGQRHIAVDYSAEATGRLRNRGGIEVETADICEWAPSAGVAPDVIVLSHVLEHLEQPSLALESVRRALNPGYLVVEVPLEDLPAARLKARFRNRTRNTAGHVQFYRRSSFLRLLADAGFEVLAMRQYAPVLPVSAIQFASERDCLPVARRVIRIITNHYASLLLQPLWCRLWYGHLAVLCRPADMQVEAGTARRMRGTAVEIP